MFIIELWRVSNHCALPGPEVIYDDRYKQARAAYLRDGGHGVNSGSYSSNFWSSSANENNSNNAWNVNFNNGNSNNNNRNNNKPVRLVRGGEWYPVSASFEALYMAWLSCRRRKRKTPQAQRFEISLLDNLMALMQSLRERTWQPSPPVCFVVAQPKGREVHAAHFSDRVIHHYLVPQLDALYEPVFIHDLYSSRKNKGTHRAVTRLQTFMRQQQGGSTQPKKPGDGPYYLQLDVANFFNTIDRPILFKMLQKTLHKALNKKQISRGKAEELRLLCHVILKQDVAHESTLIATTQEYKRVPPHKRMSNAGEGKALPIGNLTSQLFANVYLNLLDQYIKHELKCKHYIRYVDDMILLHSSQVQLKIWQLKIENFLKTELELTLRDEKPLRPIHDGADFLGYIVRPDYKLVRRRVVGNCWAKLIAFEKIMLTGDIKGKWQLNLEPRIREQLRSTLGSYWGHFTHANSHRLQNRIWQRFTWLSLLFWRTHKKLIPLWQPLSVTSFQSQCRYFQALFPFAKVQIQKGWRFECLSSLNVPHNEGDLRHKVIGVKVQEQGYLAGGLKRRCVEQLTVQVAA